MASVNQDALDYSNDVQYRVANDTRCLIRKTTITTSAGQRDYSLAGDVILLKAVISMGQPLPYLPVADALAFLSLPTEPNLLTPSYFVVGTTISFVPTPTDAQTLTIFYEARPAPLTSDDEFEITGDYERLAERLIQSYKLADDGQPELAAEEQAWYDVEMPRLRRRDRSEARGRVRVIGWDGVS